MHGVVHKVIELRVIQVVLPVVVTECNEGGVYDGGNEGAGHNGSKPYIA